MIFRALQTSVVLETAHFSFSAFRLSVETGLEVDLALFLVVKNVEQEWN